MDQMKEKALDYCNWMIGNLKDAINKNEAEPEWIEQWKESGRMWLYIRNLIEKHGE